MKNNRKKNNTFLLFKTCIHGTCMYLYVFNGHVWYIHVLHYTSRWVVCLCFAYVAFLFCSIGALEARMWEPSRHCLMVIYSYGWAHYVWCLFVLTVEHNKRQKEQIDRIKLAYDIITKPLKEHMGWRDMPLRRGLFAVFSYGAVAVCPYETFWLAGVS